MNYSSLFSGLVVTVFCSSAAAQLAFQDVTQEAGISHSGWTWGASWGDYSGNGYPDLWLSNHGTPGPRGIPGRPHLYENLGNGTFVEILNGVWSPPFLSDMHGSAWADYDNDSDQDLLTLVGANGGTGSGPNNFLVNTPSGLENLASALGLSYPLGRGRTPMWFDFDGDGVLDVVLSNAARPGNEAPPAVFRSTRLGFSIANNLTGFNVTGADFCLLSDVTFDGRPDLVVGGWHFPQKTYDISTLPFTDVTDAITFPATSNAFDAVLADLTGDLRPDAIIATYAVVRSAVQVSSTRIEADIYAVQEEVGISFQAQGLLVFNMISGWAGIPQIDIEDIHIGSLGFNPHGTVFALNSNDPGVHGIAPHVPGVSTGIYIGFDSVTGTWTLLHSWPTEHKLWLAVDSESPMQAPTTIGFPPFKPHKPDRYLVFSQGGWIDQTESRGMGVPSSSVSAVAGDFDNDMDLDIYTVCTGPVVNLPNRLYENLGQGTFALVPFAGGAEGPTSGRGETVVTADFDNDGFLDLFVTNGESFFPFGWEGPDVLLRNQGNDNHWLEIDLQGTASNRDGIGARVLVTAGDKIQVREQGGGMHARAQNHSRLHFGLGANTTIERIDVFWPGPLYTRQTFENVRVDRILNVTETASTWLGGDPDR